MVSIICKSRLQKLQRQYAGSSSVFLQTETLVETERQCYYANGFSNCSSTPSEISFHGLPSKCNNALVSGNRSLLSSQLIVLLFLRNSYMQKDSLPNIFSPVFSWTFRKFLQHINKKFWKFLESSQKKYPGRNFILVKLQAFTEVATRGVL